MKKLTGKAVGIADFKARLSEYLRVVRAGHAVTILDRETPIARVVPYEAAGDALVVRKPLRRLADVALPPPVRKPTDSLSLLLEERQAER